jgi:hypothetical protein
MKKQTRIQPPATCLVFVLAIWFAGPACASRLEALPGQKTRPTTVSTQQRTETVAAIVRAEKANLRRSASISGGVVAVVSKGTLLSLVDATPVGPWYRVREAKTDSEGWVHGNTIALLKTTGAPASPSDDLANPRSTPITPTPAQRPRVTSPHPAGRSYVNVDGVRVPSPVFTETKPSGATARCRDGSYSFSQHRSGTCSHHGGVAEWF